MHIAIIGGLDRNQAVFDKLAALSGHTVELHNGDMAGRGSGILDAIVARADLVVIVTEINSHGAVQSARKHLRATDTPSLIVRKFGTARFLKLLDALDKEKARRISLPLAKVAPLAWEKAS